MLFLLCRIFFFPANWCWCWLHAMRNIFTFNTQSNLFESFSSALYSRDHFQLYFTMHFEWMKFIFIFFHHHRNHHLSMTMFSGERENKMCINKPLHIMITMESWSCFYLNFDIPTLRFAKQTIVNTSIKQHFIIYSPTRLEFLHTFIHSFCHLSHSLHNIDDSVKYNVVIQYINKHIL